MSTEPGVTLSVSLQIWPKQIIRIVNCRDQMLLHLKGTRFWILFFSFFLYNLNKSKKDGFPGGSVVKNLPPNARDAVEAGLIPESGRSSGERNGKLLQYSCLGNPMDREDRWATVHGITKSRTRVSTRRCWYHDAKTAVLYYWCGIRETLIIQRKINPPYPQVLHPWIQPTVDEKCFEKISNSKYLPHTGNYLHSICIVFTTIYIVVYIARNLEMIPKMYGMMSAGYMQTLSHCIWGTWASPNFGTCRGRGGGVCCPGTNSRGYWRTTVVYLL